ncbi:MAG: ATP-binding protein, partial [Oscillochloris sp.]|nr:ATP-binding protein [Oscillochloris sp.]
LDLQPLDLKALIQRIVEHMQIGTEHHELRVVGNLPDLYCVCDERRIERVVENLLSNAIKYSPRGGSVTIEVSQQEYMEQVWALVTVTDTGIGIPSADVRAIFDHFHRGRNTTGRIHGTGLGLASARRIVEQHGGEIEVASVEGQGSIFTFRLPRG